MWSLLCISSLGIKPFSLFFCKFKDPLLLFKQEVLFYYFLSTINSQIKFENVTGSSIDIPSINNA